MKFGQWNGTRARRPLQYQTNRTSVIMAVKTLNRRCVGRVDRRSWWSRRRRGRKAYSLGCEGDGLVSDTLALCPRGVRTRFAYESTE